VATGTVITK